MLTASPTQTILSVQDILRDNPALHRDENGKPIHMAITGGVAAFIGQNVHEGDYTIETGAGMSTLCFLARGAHHTAIAPDSGLEPRLRQYCREHGIPDERLTYISKTSQDAVWDVQGQFQCALIDGGHGFPIRFIDFYYLQRRLNKGGYLIIDDLEIWTGETLAKFLSCEPAWKPVVQDGVRAIVFQKVGDAPDVEWAQQEFVAKSSLHPFCLQTAIPRQEFRPEPRLRSRGAVAPLPAPAAPSLDYRPATLPADPPHPAPALGQSGTLPPGRWPSAVGELLNAANQRFAQGDLRACCALLKGASRLAPQSAEILGSLASLHFQLGEFPESRRQFEQAVQLDPANAVLHVQLAAVCFQVQDAPAFEAALRKALALNPNCEEALRFLANANLQSGNLAQAAQVYQRLVALRPNDTAALLALAKCCYHLDQRSAARQLYEQVIRLEPGNAIAAEALQIIRAGGNGAANGMVCGPSGHTASVPLNGRAQPAEAPCSQSGSPAPAGNGARPVQDEEAARNREEVAWWRQFIFKSFDSSRPVSERKFLERFQGECQGRWHYICELLGQDPQWCAQLSVLDVGNGPCGILNVIPARIKIGVDPNNELYQRNQILYNLNHDVMYVPSRAESIPLLEASFDFITCTNVLDHVTDPGAVLKEVRRLLKPGGLFFLSVDTRKPQETIIFHPHALDARRVIEWAQPLVLLASRQDQPCYDEHPTNLRLDAAFQKPARTTLRPTPQPECHEPAENHHHHALV